MASIVSTPSRFGLLLGCSIYFAVKTKTKKTKENSNKRACVCVPPSLSLCVHMGVSEPTLSVSAAEQPSMTRLCVSVCTGPRAEGHRPWLGSCWGHQHTATSSRGLRVTRLSSRRPDPLPSSTHTTCRATPNGHVRYSVRVYTVMYITVTRVYIIYYNITV